jgi:hypothetical protein
VQTRRFNWIILLVASLISFGVGVAGVVAGAGTSTAPWFVIGTAALIGAFVLHRMRLP